MPKKPQRERSVIVVDQGDHERFEFLRQVFESQQVQVVRDRRKADRRQTRRPAAAERRAGERRAPKRPDQPEGGFQIHKRQEE